jgi:hypothetical protein
MGRSRLILSAGLLAVALALGADSYARWRRPAAVPSTTCPHFQICPYCRGWDAFRAGESLSGNPFASPSNPDDPTSPWARWKGGWEAGQRNSQPLLSTAIAED